jgi:hypothetical protein
MTSRPAMPWLVVAGYLLGMAGIALALTVTFLAMRGVLDVGGQCASGGPYVIATPCPDGTWLLPLAIPIGLLFVFLAFATGSRIGGIYGSLPGLAWVALFCTLGFNFLQYGLAAFGDPDAGGAGIIFVLLGVMFEVMGLAPLIMTLVGLRAGRGLPLAAGSSSADAPGSDPEDPFSGSGLFGSIGREESSATAGPADPTQPSGPALVDAIERLTTLHQQGNLSDDEFAAAKHALIEGQG